MAILNSNPIVLKDSGLSLENSLITAHTTEISNNAIDKVKVRAQTRFFLNPEKMLESPTNALKVDGYDTKEKYIFEFDYPVTDRNVFYYFDLKLKDHLLFCFPDWDESKLILTTEPSE